MYRIAICDDDESELAYVARTVEKTFANKAVEIIVESYTKAAVLLIDNRNNPYDIVFLDLDMAEVNGMEAAECIGLQNCDTEIVFVTNHAELVYKAYRFKAIGFVRKNYLEEEIGEAVDVFLKEINDRNQYMLLKDSSRMYRLRASDVMYLSSEDHYIKFVTQNEEYVIRGVMNEMEKKYSKYGFIRIHARTMVNYRYIYSLQHKEVVLVDGKRLAMSRGREDSAKKIFQYYLRQ